MLDGSSPLNSGICDDNLALAKASTALSVIVSDAALSNSCSAMPQMAVLAPRASKKEDTAACSRVVNGCKGSVWQQSPKSFAGCPFVSTKLNWRYNDCPRGRMRGGCRTGNAHQTCALQNPHDRAAESAGRCAHTRKLHRTDQAQLASSTAQTHLPSAQSSARLKALQQEQ